MPRYFSQRDLPLNDWGQLKQVKAIRYIDEVSRPTKPAFQVRNAQHNQAVAHHRRASAASRFQEQVFQEQVFQEQVFQEKVGKPTFTARAVNITDAIRAKTQSKAGPR